MSETLALNQDPPAPEDWGTRRPNVLGRAILALSRHTPLGRGAFRKLLSNAFRAVHTGAVDTHLWGAKVRLHPWNNVSERKALFRPDRMDPVEHRLLVTIMKARPSVFVDIGGNAGLYSLHAAIVAAEGSRVLTVEPNPELMDRFVFNLGLAFREDRIARNVKVETITIALSDFDGEARLSTGRGEGTRRLVGAGSGERVPVRRLLSLARDHRIERIDLLKIDVEGVEDKIIVPFFETAPESLWPFAVIIEHVSENIWTIDCVDELLKRGYRLTAKSRTNSILERPPAGPEPGVAKSLAERGAAAGPAHHPVVSRAGAEVVSLSHATPIAAGSQRVVFIHPTDPSLIIKVPVERYVQSRSGKIGKWYKRPYKRLLRIRHFLVFLREIKEHLAVRAVASGIPPYMQTIVGFVETDLGMGLTTRAVRTEDGEIAPTLKSLVIEGKFDNKAREHLREFFEWLVESPVVVGDLNLSNIVYGHIPGRGRVFVAIDGLGDRNLIPFNSLSRSMNHRAKRRRVNHLIRQIEYFSTARG